MNRGLMGMSRYLAIVTIVASIACVSFSQPSAALAPSGGIGGRPANPDPRNPRTQSIFIYQLPAGGQKTDQLLVSNNTRESQTIDIYAVDGQVTNTGAYTCKQRAEPVSAMGKWLRPSVSTITLAPIATQLVTFSLDVPKTIAPGEYDGCLVMARKDDPGVPTGTGNISIQTRQAIRVVETVPGALASDVSIKDFSASEQNGKQSYTLSLFNKGNVSSDTKVKVTASNRADKNFFSDGGTYPVLANEKLDQIFEANKRPFFGGWFDVQASISYNKEPGKFGIDGPQLVKKSHIIRLYIPPTSGALALAAIVGVVTVGLIAWLGVYFLITSRIRSWDDYIVTHSESIESIAKKHSIGWKRLARANRMKSPYTLEKGMTIKVPPNSNISKKK